MNLGQFARHHYGPPRAEDPFNVLEGLENSMRSFIEHERGRLIPQGFKCARPLAGFRRQKAREHETISRQSRRHQTRELRACSGQPIHGRLRGAATGGHGA